MPFHTAHSPTTLLKTALYAFAIVYGAAPIVAQVVNIDCGSASSYTAANGTVWQGDQDFAGGNRYYGGYPVSGTPDPGLYSWARVGYYGDFSYSIPIPNGSYILTLKFAELQYSAAGSRVFNVFVNGVQVLNNFDIVAAVGSLTAVDKPFPVQVTNGIIEIDVKGVVNLGILNGIQIVPDNSSLPPVLKVSGGSLTFTGAATGTNPAPQAVTITNGGGSTLSWTAGATQPWVVLPVTSGTGPATLSIGVSTSGLSQGTYTDTVTISDPGVAGSPASVSVTLNVGPPGLPNSASFVTLDSTTQGNWQNAYGGDGYYFVGGTPALPAYAQMAVNGASTYTWTPSTTDIRALLQVNKSSRIAATWYSSGVFGFNLNLTGGSHPVAIYALDYDRSSRAERIDILDGGSNAVLDTRTINNFQPGQYLVWNLSGNVVLRVTPLSGPNGVVSGIFFGGAPQQQTPPPASPVLSLSTGALTFAATAGGANPAAQPLTISNTGGGTLNWTATKTQSWLTLSSSSGTAPASLSIGVNTAGLTAATYTDTLTINASGAGGSPATVTVTLNLSAPANPVLSVSTGTLTFGAVVGGSNPAVQPVTISNTGAGTLSWTATKTQSWLTLSSSSGTAPAGLSIGVNTSGLTAGTYKDTVTIAASGATGSPATVAVTLNFGASASVSFVKVDKTTQGNWKGAYGADGYSLVQVAPALPTYAQMTVTGAATFAWSGTGSEPRALQPVSGTARVAAVWYSSSSFTLDVNTTDGNTHQVALYASDYDNSGRTERIDVLDSGTGTLLDTHDLSGFLNGQYLVWNLSGHVVIRVTPTAGPNGVVNALFFGGALQPAALPSPVPSLSTSTVTFGAAAGGSNPASQPVTISNTGGSTLSWTATKTQSWLTLSSASGTAPATLSIGVNTAGLTAATYTDTVTINASGVGGSPATVTVTLNLSAAANPVLSVSTGTLTFGASAGGSNPAAQPVTISNTGGGTLNWTATKTQSWLTLSSASGTAPASLSIGVETAGLTAATYTDTVTISSIGATGSPATITVTLNLGGATSVSFLSLDTAASGNWTSAYGSEGYDFVGSTPQLPSWAQVTPTGASTFVWSGSTSAPNALQQLDGSGRIAAVWYSASAFSLDVNLTDGNAHNVALYFCDYDGSGRVERVDVLDSVTGTILDSHSLDHFQPGQYLVWSVNGHVAFRVTKTAGPNGVVNGIFLGASQRQNLPAVLSLNTNVLRFLGTPGGSAPVSQSVPITNAGGSALNWTATNTQSWLSVSPSSGAGPGALTMSVSTAGLAAGTYTDTVTVNAPGAAGSPAGIGVTLLLGASVGLGPITNWTFDTNWVTPSSVLDSSANAIHASIFGTPVQGPGVIGQALTFDGVSAFLQTQPDPRPAMIGDLTLAAWIRTTNSTRNETILSKYNSSGSEDGYILETTAAGYLGVHLGGDNAGVAANQDNLDRTNKINDGQWHHVAAIIRTGQDVSLYVDGGLSSIFYLTTFNGAIGPAVGIAGPATRVANLFTGSMDEVRIYGRALSTAEIAQLYGGAVTTVSGGELLYNGISMPKNFPPNTAPTQALRTPYYINNGPRVLPIDVGRQLFVDDFLIEKTTLQRTQHQPTIYPNPVLTPGTPISGGAWFDPASNLYKMWYYNTTNDYRYAYSSDGINWTLPTYSDVYVPGTNEVVRGGDTIWLDQQETDPSRRYKSFGVDVGAGKIYVYFSADGIHWTGPNDYGIISLGDRSSVFWNPFRKVWVNSDRYSAGLPATPLRDAQDPRVRFYSESSNLTTWTPSNPRNTFWTGPDDHDPPYYLNNPGGQPPELYNLDAVAYESVMVGLFSWFYPGSGYKDYTLPGPVLVEVGVGFSRDGFSWVRPTRSSGPNPGGAFIPASNVAGTWNAYNTQSVGGGMLVVGDELWFYFSARTLQKPLDGTFSTGLATLRRDGFYSMDAADTPGTLVTHPLRFSGSHLFVNVNDPAGQLTVEALDSNGNVIPGFATTDCVPVSANATRQEVTWNGANIASLAGQNVKFRFSLTNGSLYSFWVTASAQGASNGYVGAGGPGFTGITDTVGSAGHP